MGGTGGASLGSDAAPSGDAGRQNQRVSEVAATRQGDRRRSLLDLLIAVLLGGATFVLYASTLAPTVLAGDGGEFQFVPYLLGVAHPTGYPLYLLLGWAWSHLLPVGDVAYRLNLFSAFWAALAVGMLYPAARILLRQAYPNLLPLIRRLLAILAAATFAVTPTLWSQAVIAEVYGLHVFFVVLLFFLLLTWADGTRQATPSNRTLLLAAGCFGLSLTHHRTTLLLAPAVLVFVWLTDRRVYRDGRLLLKALLLVLLPLLLYLYIPLRAPHTPYLRLPLSGDQELVLYENSLTNFFSFVMGGPFGGSVDFSIDLGARLAEAWGFLRGEFGGPGLVLAVIGIGWLVVRRHWGLVALTGLTYLASVVFNLVYTIGDIYVLYIPSYLVVVLWLAVGAGTVVQVVTWAWGRLARGRHPGSYESSTAESLVGVVAVLLFFALPLWLVVANYAGLDQSRNTRARTRWEAILSEPLPPDATLISDDRNNIMPLWYMQYVDGIRPDLLGLFPLITPDYPSLGQVLDLALSSGRPVYLIKEMPGIEARVEVEAEGDLWRVVGPAIEGEPAYRVDARLEDAVALVGYDRAPHSPHPGETLQVRLYWEALRPLQAEYHSYVHLVDASGEAVAQSDHQPGGVFYPTTLWQPGERLADDHLLAVPDDVPVGVYRLLVGMYTFAEDGTPGDTLMPLGDPVVAGQVAVKAELPNGAQDGVQTEPDPFSQPVGARFGDQQTGQIELMAYDAAAGDGVLAVTLYWRNLQPVVEDYTVFVHLLDAGGETVAQHDGPPQEGAYPTSVWDPGEVVADEHRLSLPHGFPQGDYLLRVGLYLLETGERLLVVGDGDSVELELE